MRFFLGTPTKKTVIEHNTDNLTRKEPITHRDLVISAIATVLKTWQHYACFSHRAKQGARKVIDCRLVIKWKFVLDDGYADFDPLKEVIHCNKPGAGLKDARRRFH